MDITNKTRKPLSVPLPDSKKLFLGPGKTGQISNKAVDHPALQAMVEAGEIQIEIVGDGSGRADGDGGGQKRSGDQAHRGDGGIRRTGDR